VAGAGRRERAEALRLVADQAPGLVLSDVDMPVMDGLEFGRALAARRPGLPIVFMSGNPETQTRALSLHFLCKPFSLESLERALDGALSVQQRMAAG
jgi:CheY-like chemotaxis protein